MIRSKRSAPTMLVLLSVVALGALAVPNTADAKSVQWDTVVQGVLLRKLTFFGGPGVGPEPDGSNSWIMGLADPNISVSYHATVTNQDTNTVISDGDDIPVGTNVRFNFRSHHFTDIHWFGTGYFMDSPYGDWITNAQSPTPEVPECSDKDLVANVTKSTKIFPVYIPLSVNPPTKTLTGTDPLSCGALTNGVMDCVATTPGAVAGNFVFEPTFGKFYYRYEDTILGNTYCIGDNTPMRLESNPSEEFTLQVPQQTIPFTFTVDAGSQTNTPPTTPTIAGPIEGVLDTDYVFTTTAVDPDGNTIRYGVDWTGDGVVNQWVPATTMVASGTAQDVTRRWSTTGTKTFQVLAQDEAGAVSGWASHSIILTESPTAQPLPDCPAPAHYLDIDGNGVLNDTDNNLLVLHLNAIALGLNPAPPASNNAPWQNQVNSVDVNNDGVVTTLDSLRLGTYYLSGTTISLPEPGAACATPTPTPTPSQPQETFNPGVIREVE